MTSHEAAASNTLLQPGDELGNYTIRRLLGSGGMAEVYQAREKSDKAVRDVAIKVLMPEHQNRGDLVSRFRREADVLIQFNHAHIVRIYDYDVFKHRSLLDLPVIVMQYVDGGSLEGTLTRPQALSHRKLVLMLHNLASALDYAHDKGVIHRDIKPSNILLDGQGDPFLSDFGIAKILEGDGNERSIYLTQEGRHIGTPAYMSPEQYKSNQSLDRTSDVFSFAVTVYQLLTGKLPFEGKTTSDYILHYASASPPFENPPVTLSSEAQTVILKALDREPWKRYQKVSEFVDALTPTLTGNTPVRVETKSVSEDEEERRTKPDIAVDSSGTQPRRPPQPKPAPPVEVKPKSGTMPRPVNVTVSFQPGVRQITVPQRCPVCMNTATVAVQAPVKGSVQTLPVLLCERHHADYRNVGSGFYVRHAVAVIVAVGALIGSVLVNIPVIGAFVCAALAFWVVRDRAYWRSSPSRTVRARLRLHWKHNHLAWDDVPFVYARQLAERNPGSTAT